MTIEISAIAIPVTITFIAFFWAWFIVGWNDTSPFSGIDNLMATVPASLVSLVAWIAYAIFN